MGFVAHAYEAVTVAGTAIGFTAATYLTADGAAVYVETNPIRFTIDGTTPTSSTGILVDPGYVIYLDSQDQVQKFKAIRTGSSATIRCIFGKGNLQFGVFPSAADSSAAAASQVVAGDVASGAADSGNPVKVGFKGITGDPTAVTNLQRVDAASDEYGRQETIWAQSIGNAGSDGLTIVAFPFIAHGANATGQRPIVGGVVDFNGTSWDRHRNNTELTVLASAARTVATQSADQTNYNNAYAHVQINVTAYTSGGLTATIQGKDPVSGTYYTILTGVKLAATGLQVLKVGPGMIASANACAQDMLPRTWRVSLVVDDATSITYSVGASLGVG